jgi:serine/threonine protein kinase
MSDLTVRSMLGSRIGTSIMNKPHDPNQTAHIPAVPADSLGAVDPLATTDHAPGPASTVDSRAAAPPASDGSASNLPAIPGYRVLREIARGGMGRIFAAHDLTLDREVAVKVLLPGANADRFVRESKITARLPHPGIPPIYALGRLADGSPFLAMKLIAGQTLSAELTTADQPRLLQAFTQVCQAVGFAHSRGVIHRDLKPANIMVGAFGEVQVMDWGLAKELPMADGRSQIDKTAVAGEAGGVRHLFRHQRVIFRCRKRCLIPYRPSAICNRKRRCPGRSWVPGMANARQSDDRETGHPDPAQPSR